MMGRSLMQTLAVAVMEMRGRRHECLTLEHILLAMTHERTGRLILEGCGVDLAELRRQLDTYLTTFIGRFVRPDASKPKWATCWPPCLKKKTAGPFTFCVART